MSHTPGPWKFEVVDETNSFLGCKRLDGGSGSTVIDLSNEWTGYPECGQDLQMTISKDDAALIAAALEMLEVLEALVSMVDSGDYRQEILDLAEAAIRKARGEGMTHIPICPHCGQSDEENIWLAKQQDEEYDDIFDCERCGGVYRLRNRGGAYEVEARYEVEAGEE